MLARRRWMRVIAMLGPIAAALGALGGCASDQGYKEGVSWVTYNEAEKKRLNDAGFPQYSGAQ